MTTGLPPLCVDLDGTLCRTDLLVENFLANLSHPGVLLQTPFWLLRGKAVLKSELAKHHPPDAATLPYNEQLLAHLKSEKARGRRLILATASDQSLARAVAAHLGLFDDIIASDGTHNAKGPGKLRAIREKLGDAPFDYAGNDASDLAVWREAREGIVVNAPATVGRVADKITRVTLVIDDRKPLLHGLLRAMRPHQWCKNLLVFVPLLTSGAFTEWAGWSAGFLTLAAFCAMASGIYIANDLTDIATDRQHHRKRNRPFASGAVSPLLGTGLSLVLVVSGLLLAHHTGVATLLALYALTSLVYSVRLKELPLVDVFCLAFLYTIRLYTGGVAVKHFTSPWLLGFSTFLFLSLAFVKRVAELRKMEEEGRAQTIRRGYSVADISILSSMGIAATFTSTLVLALFIQSAAAISQYATPDLIWLIVPIIAFWQCRLWLSTARGYMHDDPIIYAAGDWVSWTAAVAVMMIMVAARYLHLALAIYRP